MGNKLKKAKKFLVILEILESIQAAFILGIITYLFSVVRLAYMFDILYFIFVLSAIFLFSSVKGVYRYYKEYSF